MIQCYLGAFSDFNKLDALSDTGVSAVFPQKTALLISPYVCMHVCIFVSMSVYVCIFCFSKIYHYDRAKQNAKRICLPAEDVHVDQPRLSRTWVYVYSIDIGLTWVNASCT